MTELTNKTTSLVDHFLIAMPQLDGSYFSQSLIYMWRHSDEGALGLVVNLPLEMHLGEILEQLDMDDDYPGVANEEVLSGGPVETEKGFILHDAPTRWTSTIDVTDEIRVTTSRDILADISKGAGPDNYLVTLGCAGWSAGQLEQELADNAWLVCPASKEILFSRDFANKPNMATATMGFSMSQLAADAGHC